MWKGIVAIAQFLAGLVGLGNKAADAQHDANLRTQGSDEAVKEGQADVIAQAVKDKSIEQKMDAGADPDFNRSVHDRFGHTR